MPKGKIVAIVGPTAAGKSALAVRLASELSGEVVSADSRQVYRQMDIGTAKPSKAQQAAAPHHLIDIVDSDEEYSLALFLRQARTAIHEIQSRSKLPIVAGGTGQYVLGLLEGWQVPEVQPDPGLRRELEARADGEGAVALHQELARLDPAAARRIDPQNARRVIRALEIHHASPMRPSEPARTPPDFAPVVLGLTLERAALDQRIDERVDRMIEAGWVDEVRGLIDRGYTEDLPSMSGLGYREIGQHLAGELSIQEAAARIKQRTRRFARQQYAWFKPDDERISWFEASPEGLEAAEDHVKALFAPGS